MSRTEELKVAVYARVATRKQIAGITASENSRNAYLYARVKGGACSQIDECLLAAQREQLLECAKAMGYEVANQEAEIGRWGITEGAERRLLDAAASGEIGILLVTACSRLHRDSEHLNDLLKELDHHSVQIYSLQEGWVNVPEKKGQPTMLDLLLALRTIDQKAGDLNVIS